MTDVKDLIDLLDRAYLAMNDAEDELIELSLPATWQKKASDIADEINTLQQRIIKHIQEVTT